MTTTPEQLIKWRKEFESRYSKQTIEGRVDVYKIPFIEGQWKNFLEEKAEEIHKENTLKLAKFGALVMRDFKNLTAVKINTHALAQDFIVNGSEVNPHIEATIKELLK